ncbi:MAG: ABC transporter substrate-binding protein [Candidatus Thiodiazotropha sp. (ex Monitilora ramsayi)]|nr:ABC transporter substrate-binding protein [Candidatus Thiodiazotropha sp. (ex Monitilora ramsayi)]
MSYVFIFKNAVHSLFLILFTVLLTSCSVEQVVDKGSIRFGISARPLNLDPRFATDALSTRLNRLFYQRLVEVDNNSFPVPGIADWSIINPKQYRFILNENAGTYPDGEIIKANDVVQTYRAVLDESTLSPHRAALELIEDVRLINDKTVDFFLNRQDPLFPAYLELNILPAKQINNGHPFANRPFGSGEFIFLETDTAGVMKIQRKRDGHIFEIVEVKNPLVRVLKLLRGEIDLLQNDLTPELLGFLNSHESIGILNNPGSSFSYLGFNIQDPIVSDLRVRRAIAHAIDRKKIIEMVMQGSAREAESLFPPEHWAGNSQLTPHRFNPEKSRELLREAGYGPNNPLRLVYKTSSDPFRIRLATIIQAQLSQIGIEVELKSYDWGTFFGDIKAGNFQLYSLSWVGVRTPDVFRYIFASDSIPPTGANRGRYKSAVVDELLREAEQATTIESQTEIYRQVALQIHKDLPYVPLWFEDQYAAYGHRITGYRVSTDGNYDGLNHIEIVNSKGNLHAQPISAH